MTHLIFGAIAVAAGLVGVFAWWSDFGLVLRGLLPIVLVVVGFIAIGAGLFSDASRRKEVPFER